ncbi:sulfate transporter family-domain-containing protein [Phyllosticta citrichinensis]|uniref:Sulfate transporter family-domain-containing protein n=1 Tax=Phyllosticta citrichinensis TaxID=1130410 RepID=A0ABR1XLA4_9PEZI
MPSPPSPNSSSRPPSIHSRTASTSRSAAHQHAPSNPTRLREAHSASSPSPEDLMSPASCHTREPSGAHEPRVEDTGIRPTMPDHASATSIRSSARADPPADDSTDEPTARTRLLASQNRDDKSAGYGADGRENAFSRPPVKRSYGSFGSTFSGLVGGPYPGVSDGPPGGGGSGGGVGDVLGDSVTDGLLGGGPLKRPTTTAWLAERHGIQNRRSMYLAYYIPIFNWLRQYKWRYLRGDFVSALTMASFYIPMSLSYAANLGHLPPVNGLYSFVFNPFIYAIFGTAPLMVVGPEAPGSLLTGEVVRENIRNGHTGDHADQRNAEIAGITTFIAGAVILLSGLFRLGFLDNVLSRPFLRGFISAIGVVIFVDQLIPELGIARLAEGAGGVEHGSTIDKLIFIIEHLGKAHKLTCAVSFSAFFFIMFCREMKKRLQHRYSWIVYIPDRFIVVVLSAIITWQLRLDQKGLAILGNVNTSGGALFRVHLPFRLSHLKYASDAFSTAFTIALLGFFESSVAAKSLPTPKDGIENVHVSANRELVALGIANVTGGLFMALPAFGGYGRSKVNASTGGKTPMSSILLSLLTLICVLFLLPYFYYLPKGVLSAMVSVVACSLVEEAPHDIRFFLRIRGLSELSLMLVIFLVTIFWDLKKGIAVGIGLSLLRVIRHSTRPRIQILGRVPGTTDRFENAELGFVNGDPDHPAAAPQPQALEFIEGALIVKIPEPLTFANTGDLRNRLKRLEYHGTGAAHPALPRVRDDAHNANIIFDVHGVTSLDGAGAQVLAEIVAGYVERGVRVFFCRVRRGTASASAASGAVSSANAGSIAGLASVKKKKSAAAGDDVWRLFVDSGIVETVGGESHFVESVGEAIRLTEREGTTTGAATPVPAASAGGLAGGGGSGGSGVRSPVGGLSRSSTAAAAAAGMGMGAVASGREVV